LGENQEFLEFIANSVTDPCVETMIVEVIKNAKFVKVIYDYEGSHANKKLPRRNYASVSVSIEEGYSFDFSRGVAYTYFPDIEKLLEQL
jgi:hypothetical protein